MHSDNVSLSNEQAAHVTSSLNQLLRRFRQSLSIEDWASIVLDGASLYAPQVALLEVQGSYLIPRGGRGLDPLPIESDSAAAFRSVLASKDPVVALRTVAEVGESLAGVHRSERAHIVPITSGKRVAALLFAAGTAPLHSDGLELVASLASVSLELRGGTPPATVQIAPAAPKKAEAQRPSWHSLPVDDRMLHLRAQRFARTSVAQILLTKPTASRAGLEQSDLYLFLKKEIDSARNGYRLQFLGIPSMVDYLHLELVRTAADGNEEKLGPEYPGHLV